MTQNAYDVPLSAPTPAPQSWNPMQPPAPLNYQLPPALVQPPGAPGPVPSAAPAARARKDAKKDTATKVGRKVLNATSAVPSATAAPPAPPIPAEAPPPNRPAPIAAPPMQANTAAVPKYESPTFTPAKYEPPKKGLEYLALGLGLLFPGAPIARAAASFAGGLQQGAQQKYQREETAAEQQYKVAQSTAQAKFQNEQALFAAGDAEARRQFLNGQAAAGVDNAAALAKWQDGVDAFKRTHDNRLHGLDPTGKPYPVPPALAKPLPPNAPATAYVQQSTALAKWYSDNGMTEKAADVQAQAAAYQKQVDETAKFNQQLRMFDLGTVRAEHLASIRESGSVARAAASAGTRELAADARQRSEFTVKAGAAYKDAYGNLFKLTKGSQKVDENGQPVAGAFLPPAIDAKGQQQLATTLRQIRSSEDPAGLARYIAEHTDNAAIADVIQSFGTAADLEKRGKGVAPPDLPDSYYDSMFKQQPKAAALPATRVVNGATFYLHSDKKYYPTPEGHTAPTHTALPLNMDAAASGTP